MSQLQELTAVRLDYFNKVTYEKCHLFGTKFIDCQPKLTSNLKLSNSTFSIFTLGQFVLPLSTKNKSSAKPNDNDTRISVCRYLLLESTVIQVTTRKQSQSEDAKWLEIWVWGSYCYCRQLLEAVRGLIGVA